MDSQKEELKKKPKYVEVDKGSKKHQEDKKDWHQGGQNFSSGNKKKYREKKH